MPAMNSVQAQLPVFRSTADLVRDQAQNGLGQMGFLYVANGKDAVAPTGKTFSTIHCISGVTINELDNNNMADGDPFTAVALPNGFTLFGNFSRVNLTGQAILYYGTPR